jgi:sugar phosphate permease
MGIHQTSVYVGTIAGGFFAGVIGERYGWRWSFIVFGGMGLLLGLFLMRFLREPARSHTLGVDVQERPGLLQVLWYIVNSPAAILLLLGFSCANFVAMVLLSWMPTFLYDRFGLSVAVAGLSATLFVQVASMCGSPLGGWLADKMQKRRLGGRAAVQSAALFCGAPFILLCSQTREPAVLAFALIAWGLCKGLYDANIFASMFDVVPAEVRGTAAGVMNMIGWLCGGGLAPVAIGYLSQRVGLGTALGFTAGVYIIGGIVLLLASRLARHETVRVLAPKAVNPAPVAPGN